LEHLQEKNSRRTTRTGFLSKPHPCRARIGCPAAVRRAVAGAQLPEVMFPLAYQPGEIGFCDFTMGFKIKAWG